MKKDANEIPVRSQLRAFARLLLPLYEEEYQRQIHSPQPSWIFVSILHRRMRELEREAA
jgi:hypothetical protein